MDSPLVSAIMPTRNRPQFVQRAIDCFHSQTWPNKELVILDDRDAPSFRVVPEHTEIRYDCLHLRHQIGPKRNLCCSRAQGEFICFWDDDDYSAPGRMEQQARLLIERPWLQIVGYGSLEFRDLDTGERRLFHSLDCMPDYAPGTTLMFRKSWWRDHPFDNNPEKRSGEDTDFINFARGIKGEQGRRIVLAIPADGMMWASKHSGNSSERAWQNKSAYRELVA